MSLFSLAADLLVAAMMIVPVVAAFARPPRSHNESAAPCAEAEAAA